MGRHAQRGRAWVKVGGRGFCCMSRFDVFPGLQAEEAESSQAGTVPAEVAAGWGGGGGGGAGGGAGGGGGGGGGGGRGGGAAPAGGGGAFSAYVVSRRR